MAPISEAMLRKRAEHNEGCLSTLKEVTLHQQNIERIEVLGQVCRHLEIIYLQNNLIGRLENLHRLKELQYINLAVRELWRRKREGNCVKVTYGCSAGRAFETGRGSRPG